MALLLALVLPFSSGYYVGARARYHDRAILNVLHYDNRADPAVYESGLRDYAWLTKFDAAALRIETATDWTVIAQALIGETYIAPDHFWLDWKFASQSLMLARRRGAHMLAARYDRFGVEFMGARDAPGSEDGHAWTIAYTFATDGPWRFALEWLRLTSDVPARAMSPGENPLVTETKIELSARYLLQGTL